MSDSQQQRVSVSSLAHLKMVLHAIANPYSQIHGILVGWYDADGDAAGPRLRITDALPVCHSSPTKPVLDMAFRLADEFCFQQQQQQQKKASRRIVGWYTANERLEDRRPNQAALRVAGTISAASSSDLPAHAEPVLVVLDNARLGELLAGDGDDDGDGDGGDGQQPHAIRAYGRDVRKHWVNPVPETHFDVGDDGSDDDGDAATWAAARRALGRWSEDADDVDVYDFESHMDGGAAGVKERDWLRNPAVKL